MDEKITKKDGSCDIIDIYFQEITDIDNIPPVPKRSHLSFLVTDMPRLINYMMAYSYKTTKRHAVKILTSIQLYPGSIYIVNENAADGAVVRLSKMNKQASASNTELVYRFLYGLLKSDFAYVTSKSFDESPEAFEAFNKRLWLGLKQTIDIAAPTTDDNKITGGKYNG